MRGKEWLIATTIVVGMFLLGALTGARIHKFRTRPEPERPMQSATGGPPWVITIPQLSRKLVIAKTRYEPDSVRMTAAGVYMILAEDGTVCTTEDYPDYFVVAYATRGEEFECYWREAVTKREKSILQNDPEASPAKVPAYEQSPDRRF